MSVQLEIASLDLTSESIECCRELLSADESERADRFRTQTLTDRFTGARGALRILLSQRIGCDAKSIKFLYGLHGKPEIAQPAGARGLRFNLSHSGDLVAIAIGGPHPVGVDLEVFRPLQKPQSLARMVFSAQELDAWSRLPVEQQTTTLMRVWTLKEACLKTTGEGFSRPMTSFSIESLAAAAEPDCRFTVELTAEMHPLEAILIGALPNYSLAVAVSKNDQPIEIRLQRQSLTELVRQTTGK